VRPAALWAAYPAGWYTVIAAGPGCAQGRSTGAAGRGSGWLGIGQDAWVLTSLVAAEAELLRGVDSPRTRVLEAGCGRRNSRADSLAGLTDEIELLVGVDLDERAGGENPALDRFVVADLCGRTPFEDSSFDLVYASFVVEHLSDPRAALREWRRLLRPGGSLLVTTPNISNPLIRLATVLPQRLRIGLKRIGPGVEERDVFPALYRANRPVELDRTAREAGLVPVAVRQVATLHRYAGKRRWLRRLLLLVERPLPPSRRSTIVALYRSQ
jgi:SAM-dependent methyltransferase